MKYKSQIVIFDLADDKMAVLRIRNPIKLPLQRNSSVTESITSLGRLASSVRIYVYSPSTRDG